MANIITTLALEMNENWYVSKKFNSIGRVGENTVTKLSIEAAEILDATYEIEIMSADGSKNVAELTIDGTELYLILTANMLTTSGITKMQVRATFEDGSIKKSNIFELKVNRSINATDYYEEYSVTIFDQLVAECREIISGAESDAERAETAAEAAEGYAENASSSVEAASASASSASVSATNAAISETNASTSAANASASETNAATSATNAANSATSASTSATNAANSATSASTSASSASVSATNASISETNASTSTTEAAETAASIAASVAQINENTYRINDLEAIIAGYQLEDLPTGAVATITDGTALLMPSLKVGIEPVQDLHGYDHPWAGGAGKNLANFVQDKGIDLSGNVIDFQGRISTVEPIVVENGVDYIFKNFAQDNSVRGILAVYNGDVFVRRISNIYKDALLDVSNGDRFIFCVYSNVTIDSAKSMIVKSTDTVTNYEPYSNICPITGWSEANVSVNGKNLCNIGSASFTRSNQYPLFLSPGTYTLSSTITSTDTDGDNCAFRIYGASNISLIGGILTRNNRESYTFTLESNSTYILFYAGRNSSQSEGDDATWADIQIELGNTATTYEPYNRQTYTVQFTDGDNPLTVYGGTLDVVSGELTVTDGHIASYNGETLSSTWISDRDVYAEGTTPTAGAEVVYEFTTPITYQLTPTQVRTLIGNNSIWADTGDIIEGKYFKSLT